MGLAVVPMCRRGAQFLRFVETAVRFARGVKKSLTSILYFQNIRSMETKNAVAALAALAQDTRLAIFRLLVQAGAAGQTAGAIAERLDVPATTLSFHLKELATADLVVSESQGRFVIYRANYPAMSGLLEFLTANCCGGSECTADSVVCVPVSVPASRRTGNVPRAAAKSRRAR
jgi:ArsR family transcriptional regulator